MKKIISLNKQSKKAQRAYHAKQRGSWYGLCPVTRVVPSKKGYDRNRERKNTRMQLRGRDTL